MGAKETKIYQISIGNEKATFSGAFWAFSGKMGIATMTYAANVPGPTNTTKS